MRTLVLSDCTVIYDTWVGNKHCGKMFCKKSKQTALEVVQSLLQSHFYVTKNVFR